MRSRTTRTTPRVPSSSTRGCFTGWAADRHTADCFWGALFCVAKQCWHGAIGSLARICAWQTPDSPLCLQAYQRRVENVPYTQEDYKRMKLSQGEEAMYRTADSLLHGQSGYVPPENVDKMVAELEAVQSRRNQYSRRRAHRVDKDVDSINDRNAAFNRKLERAFGQFTKEIKANFERGTALPDR